MTYIGNLSTLYADLPRDERPAAAARDGFARVESWWDFDAANPPADELEGFLGALEAAGVQLVAMNSHGGDRAAGERGLACLHGREEEFRASIASVVRVAQRTGARFFNVTFGQLDPAGDEAAQYAEAAARYRWAAQQVEVVGGTILIEALSVAGNGSYPFHTGADVVAFLTEHLADVPNIGFLFDSFHLAANRVDVVAAAGELAPWIKHVQFADFPGRGKPGTGGLDFDAIVARLEAASYAGDFSLEYLA